MPNTFIQKLVTGYKAIEFVGKMGKKGTGLNYDWVRAADVVNAVRQFLADNGIYAEVNFEFVGAPYTIARAKAPDAPFSAVNVKCTVVLVDAETGETRTGSGLGSGADTGDKAAYKAQTGALKYALRNAFLIPDEKGQDEPEADAMLDENALADYAPPVTPLVDNGLTANIPDYTDFHGTEATTESMTPAETAAAEAATPSLIQDDPEPAPAEQSAQPDSLPTEADMKVIREEIRKISDNLSSEGKLAPSNGKRVNVKVKCFTQKEFGVADLGTLTKAQWEGFIQKLKAAGAMENGWVRLAAAVNKANE